MGWLMNGDPTDPPPRKRGRPTGSRDSQPRGPRSDSAKRKAEAEERRRRQDGTL